MEKHYLPLMELVVSSPSFVLDTEDAVEAAVEGAFVTERLVWGNITVT